MKNNKENNLNLLLCVKNICTEKWTLEKFHFFYQKKCNVDIIVGKFIKKLKGKWVSEKRTVKG